MITGRSHAPGVQGPSGDDLDDLDDGESGACDDRDDDGCAPSPGLRRRRGAAVAVAAIIALAGALLGTLHAGARAAQTERDLRLETALRTGAVSVDSTFTAVGPLRLLTASVPLVNTSARPVTAQLVTLDAPGLGRFHLPGDVGEGPVPVTVGPGSALSVQAASEVSCQDVPAADPYAQPSASPGPAAVVADVTPAEGGPSRRVRLPLAADEALQLAAQLSWACHPDSGPSAPQTSYAWLPDGRLQVELVNSASPGAPMTITATSSGGVELTSSPQLPLVLPPGGSEELLLSARVDCAAAGDGSGSGVVLSSEQAVDGGAPTGSTTIDLGAGSTGDGRPYGPSGWLTRQIALTCG